MEETRLSYLLESHKRSVLTAKVCLFFPIGDYLLTPTTAQMLVLCTESGNIKSC